MLEIEEPFWHVQADALLAHLMLRLWAIYGRYDRSAECGSSAKRRSGMATTCPALRVSQEKNAWTRFLNCSCLSLVCCCLGAGRTHLLPHASSGCGVARGGRHRRWSPLGDRIARSASAAHSLFRRNRLDCDSRAVRFASGFPKVAAAAPRGVALGVAAYLCSIAGVVGFLWLATALGYVAPISPLSWLTIGAIVGGTSSVIIMPTMALGKAPAAIARMLEVESAATDALSVVVAMVLLDFIVSGTADLSRPAFELARQLGIGVASGVCAAALLIPIIPPLRDMSHGYTVFLASMLALYALNESINGNGAMAVLTASLLLGNAASIVPRLFPGARGETFTASDTAVVLQDQMSFLIKSFFFFLIGLMFPREPRLIALGSVAVLVLLAVRIPAVALVMLGPRCNHQGTVAPQRVDSPWPRGGCTGDAPAPLWCCRRGKTRAGYVRRDRFQHTRICGRVYLGGPHAGQAWRRYESPVAAIECP